MPRRKATYLTQAASMVGRALAHLGEAVAHAGLLHQLGAQPRSADRNTAMGAARSSLHHHMESTRNTLNEAGGQLHREADRPTAPNPTAARPPASLPAGSTLATRTSHIR